MTIEAFDLDRAIIKCSFNNSAKNTAETVIANHGVTCESYKIAETFLKNLEQLQFAEDSEKTDALVINLEIDFSEAMSEYYLDLLCEEYEHCMSDEHIIDILEANNYEFTEAGARYKK
jgi:hypothetical protein